MKNILEIAGRFALKGMPAAAEQIKLGYINQTYRLETIDAENQKHNYILQQVNTKVFPDVDALMENYSLVTHHLHEGFLLEGSNAEIGSVPEIIPTKDGKNYLQTEEGCWRVITCFTDVCSMDIPDSAKTFYYAGRSFGRFLMKMQEIPAKKIHEVIPNFHNTWSRYLDLEEAIACDPVGRVHEVKSEIEFIRARKDRYNTIAKAIAEGKLPLRITHNDTNLNNILFNKESGKPVAIIDLDTVMPSTPLYDFGDSIRIGTNTACDDEHDLSKVTCDLQLYESYARGWLEMCGSMLTKYELELLPLAALIITSEDGIRFLMDHINGDTYYNIFYEKQNLYRSRTQLKLVEDMEKKMPEILDMFNQIYEELGLKTH